jgi:hypothetical protein
MELNVFFEAAQTISRFPSRVTVTLNQRSTIRGYPGMPWTLYYNARDIVTGVLYTKTASSIQEKAPQHKTSKGYILIDCSSTTISSHLKRNVIPRPVPPAYPVMTQMNFLVWMVFVFLLLGAETSACLSTLANPMLCHAINPPPQNAEQKFVTKWMGGPFQE